MTTFETTSVPKSTQLVSACYYIHEVGQYSRRLPCNKKPSVRHRAIVEQSLRECLKLHWIRRRAATWLPSANGITSFQVHSAYRMF